MVAIIKAHKAITRLTNHNNGLGRLVKAAGLQPVNAAR